MALALHHIKVYFKLTVTVLVLLAVLLVFWQNRDHVVTVWFFHPFENINVLWLIFVTAVFSALLVWVVPAVWRTVAEFRRMRRERRDQQQDQA